MRHPHVELRRLQLQPEKIRVVRVEGRVQIGFNRSQLDAVVFKAGVVAHHHESQRREEQYTRKL